MNAGKKAVKKELVAEPAQKVAAKPVAKKATPVAASKAATKVVAPAKAPVSKSSAKEEPRLSAAKPVAAKPSKAPTAKVAKAPVKDEASHSFSPEYLVLMQKDPNWMHAFWDVSERRVQQASQNGSRLVLRLYDVSRDLTVRTNKQRKFRDIEIPYEARSWYIQNQGQGGAMSVVLGSVTSSGVFEPIVNSDHVQAFGSEGQFLGGQDDLFLRASLGGAQVNGFGSSAQMLPGVSSGSFLFAPSSESFSSQSVSSASFLQHAGGADTVNKGKDFFLWVKTRLIVYGGTRPDAHLQVRGQPFPLNPDGTFSLEMDLPDSTQIIPVFATDREGDFPTTIVPIVVKRTE